MVALALVTVLAAPFFAFAASPHPQQHFATLSYDSPNVTWDLRSLSNSTFHQAYHPFVDIQAFLLALSHAHPAEVALEHVGHSAEGREIVAAVISRPQLKKNRKKYKKKPRFLVLGAQHAREWIATSTALYLAHALVSDESEPGSQTALLDLFDFYIIPTANPDGYQYTWDVDRFWYKNLMTIEGESRCRGVDMNRNWGYYWKPSSSPSEGPCAVWYPGTRPFQAPEVNALANYTEGIKRLKVFIDLRNYGQLVSVPFSHSCDAIPRDAEDLLEAALGAAAALQQVHGTVMTTGMLCDTLYRAPGNVLDWMYVNRRVKYSFAVHLRDTGTYGFTLPTEWIRPVGEEAAEMVAYLTKFVAEENKNKKKKKKKGGK